MADHGRAPNEQLRQARLRTPAASGSGRPMSREELADAVNRRVSATDDVAVQMDAGYVRRLERGESRWPNQQYRAALRAVLDAATDADLGFAVRRPPRPGQ